MARHAHGLDAAENHSTDTSRSNQPEEMSKEIRAILIEHHFCPVQARGTCRSPGKSLNGWRIWSVRIAQRIARTRDINHAIPSARHSHGRP